MKKIVAFTGESNSGKTTLIEKITNKLINRYKIAIIKHDPSDKAQFDVKGKDSYKFFQTGAEVMVTSPTRTTYFSHRQKSIEEIASMIKEFDLLFVEGLRTLNLPRIGVFRDRVNKDYFKYIKAAAIKDVDKNVFPSSIEVFDLDDLDSIIDWIFKNAKELK